MRIFEVDFFKEIDEVVKCSDVETAWKAAFEIASSMEDDFILPFPSEFEEILC